MREQEPASLPVRQLSRSSNLNLLEVRSPDLFPSLQRPFAHRKHEGQSRYLQADQWQAENNATGSAVIRPK
jgi:hypothetical protein